MAEKEEKKETLVGKICIKLAGRDSGQIGVIIEELKDNFVLIDGSVRRRKCSLKHVEILPNVVEIKKSAEHSEIVSALKKVGIIIAARKEKPKKEVSTKTRSKQASRALSRKAKEEKKAAKKEDKKKEKKAKKKETKKKAVKKAKKPTLVPEKDAKKK